MAKKSILLIGSNGYIGSYLEPVLRAQFDIATCDISGNPTYKIDFALLTARQEQLLNNFDVILLLAGYSSVPMCQLMMRTFAHNVSGPMWLLQKIQPYQKFIYASSASLYNQAGRSQSYETSPLNVPINYYDASKMAFDTFAQVSGKPYYGLRFGTVCGRSPNQRLDLIIQRMAWNAVHKQVVEVSNPQACRGILNIQDLGRAIPQIINEPKAKPGIYNMCSFNSTIDRIGQEVAKYYEVDFIYGPLTTAYNFWMDCGKFESEFYFGFDHTIQSILRQLPEDYLKSMPDLENHLRCTPYFPRA